MAIGPSMRIRSVIVRIGLLLFGILVVLYRTRIDVWPSNSNSQSGFSHFLASKPYAHSELCDGLFGHGYLDGLKSTADDHCVGGSTSKIICYKTRIALDGLRDDVFCIVEPAVIDAQATRISVDCLLKDENFKARLPRYMYATSIADGFDLMHVNRQQSAPSVEGCRNKGETLVLIRREGASHTWDCLLEIFSYFLTIRFMQSEGLLAADSDLQVVFLDEHPNGPYAHLWAIFSREPPIRKADLWRNGNICVARIILPLPGGSNPLFQGDWTRFNCKESSLVQDFRETTIQYHVSQADPIERLGEGIVLTAIKRNQTRRLVDHRAVIQRLSLMDANVHVQEVDLAAMDFGTQIQVMQGTNVLVGVHGAGLTHILYLPPGAVVVEIMPSSVQYEWFRNLARLRGLGYLRVHGDIVPEGEDWHSADIRLSKDSLEDVVEAAIYLAT